MGLKAFLYRCPLCGADPVEGRKDRVRCPACGSRFLRGHSDATVRVERTEEKAKEVPAVRLSEAIEEMGGPLPAARGDEGTIRYEAAVRVRRAVDEQPLWHRGALLGFIERREGGTSGVLRVDDNTLELVEEGTLRSRWSLLDLRAVQTNSSSVQIRAATGEIVNFRFVDDSPLRWEALLQELLRRSYRNEGRGEIVEFRPRITVR